MTPTPVIPSPAQTPRPEVTRSAPESATVPQAGPFDLALMRDAANAAAALLKSLANVDRLLLLCQLTEGEKSVGELEALVGVRQPTLSQQLCVLRKENLVSTRRAGKQIYYAVNDARALAVLGCLYKLFCHPAQESAHEH